MGAPPPDAGKGVKASPVRLSPNATESVQPPGGGWGAGAAPPELASDAQAATRRAEVTRILRI